VIVAGDVFDSANPSAAAEELYYDAWKGCPVVDGEAFLS